MQRVLASLRQGPALRNSTDLDHWLVLWRETSSAWGKGSLWSWSSTQRGGAAHCSKAKTQQEQTENARLRLGPFFQSLNKVPRSPDWHLFSSKDEHCHCLPAACSFVRKKHLRHTDYTFTTANNRCVSTSWLVPTLSWGWRRGHSAVSWGLQQHGQVNPELQKAI